MITPLSESAQNYKFSSEQTLIDPADMQQFFVVRKVANPIEWITHTDRFVSIVVIDIIIADWTNRKIHTFSIPLSTCTLITEIKFKSVEKTIADQLIKGIIKEAYAVDYFTQEAIFEEKKYDLGSKCKNKEIVICGGEIFIGDDFGILIDQAIKKYTNRPFYSYSFKNEYSTF